MALGDLGSRLGSMDGLKSPAVNRSVSSTTGVTLRSDNFNRADTPNGIGTPSDGGAGWSVTNGTWGISSNQGYESGSGAEAGCVLEASASNVAVQVTFAVISSDAGMLARFADTSNYLLAAVRPTNIQLYKVVAGSFTQLGSTYSATISNGDIVKLTCDAGSNLVVYHNGVSRITATDNAGSTNTKHGIRTNNDTTTRFDDFSIATN